MIYKKNMLELTTEQIETIINTWQITRVAVGY